MSDDDELERLLREVDSTLSGKPAPRSGRSSSAVSKPSSDDAVAPRGRFAGGVRTGTIAGVVCGGVVTVATFMFQWLPIVENPVSSGLGAFVGAFATGLALTAARRGGS
jgi:hypothetical protein